MDEDNWKLTSRAQGPSSGLTVSWLDRAIDMEGPPVYNATMT